MRKILLASAAIAALAGAAHANGLTVPAAGGIGEVSWTGNGLTGRVDVDAGTNAFAGTANNGLVSTYGKSVVNANSGVFTPSLFGASAGASALDANIDAGVGAESGSAVAGAAQAAGDVNAEVGYASRVGGLGIRPTSGHFGTLFEGQVAAGVESTFAAQSTGLVDRGVTFSATGGTTDVTVGGATAPIGKGVALFDGSSSAFAKNVSIGTGFAHSSTAAEAQVGGASAVND